LGCDPERGRRLEFAFASPLQGSDPTDRHKLAFCPDGCARFPVSLSEQFNVASQLTPDGIKVELYSFDDALVVSDGGSVHDGATYSLTGLHAP
jgi:hypothetical protein